jgi:hypothetical protein
MSALPEIENSPVVFAVRNVPWQIFATFTYHDPLPPLHRCALLRQIIIGKVCKLTHTRFCRHFSLTRFEKGEIGGRLHNHVLFGNLKPGVHITELCLRVKEYWDVHYGFARVWPYDCTLDGVQYVLKGLERYEYLTEAQSYELRKFGLTDTVYFSQELLARIKSVINREGPKTVDTPKHGEMGSLLDNGQATHGNLNGRHPAIVPDSEEHLGAGARPGVSLAEARWLCTPITVNSGGFAGKRVAYT